MKLNEELKEKLIQIREKSYIRFMTVGKILTQDFGPDEWVVDSLIPDQSITAITGSPGSFKTWLTMEIARCVSSGEKLFGKFGTKYGPIIFVDKENHLKHIQNRLKQLGFLGDHDIVYVTEENFYIDKDEDFKKLSRMVGALNPKLVIFDSLVRIHSGDENASKDIAVVMEKFRLLTKKGTSVIFVHHHRKENYKSKKSANSLRGSSDILAGVDCLLMVDKAQDENSLTIDQAKLRQQQAIEPFSVTIQKNKETGSIGFTYGGEYNPNKAVNEDAKNEIISLLSEGENKEMSRQDILETLSDDYKSGTIDSALKELVPDTVNKRSGPSNKYYFSIKK